MGSRLLGMAVYSRNMVPVSQAMGRMEHGCNQAMTDYILLDFRTVIRRRVIQVEASFSDSHQHIEFFLDIPHPFQENN
jgi:hypothetical protein